MMLFIKNFKNARFKRLFYKFIKFSKLKILLNRKRIAFVCSISKEFISSFLYFLKSYYININIILFAKMILVSEDEKYKIKDILENQKK